MRQIFILLSLSLFFHLNVCSQSVDPQTTLRWDSLNRQLQIGAALAVSYISYVSDSKTVDKNSIRQVNVEFLKLLKHLDTKVPVDSLFITTAFKLNLSLTVAMGRTLMGLENDPEFRKDPNTEFFMQKVSINDQTLSAQIDSYNHFVVQKGLPGLTFGKARKT